MELQGRNLSFGMQGDDVALLQRELGQLELDTAPIPESEIQGKQFDDGTHAAVVAFQRKFGISPINGIVDAVTARAINVEVDRLETTPEIAPTGQERRGRTFILNGTVYSHADKVGLPHLRVDALNREHQIFELFDVAVTDQDGQFQMVVSEEELARLCGNGQPELFFRIFRDTRLILDVDEGVSWVPGPQPVQLCFLINLQTPPQEQMAPGLFSVSGRVAHAIEGPKQNFLVRAYNRQLTAPDPTSPSRLIDQPLGEMAVTDERGRFRITYPRSVEPDGHIKPDPLDQSV